MRRRTDPKEPISFGQAYAQSETFQILFREGMALVEETATYLDGDGRLAARSLARPASIVYATESMRLTTRLMQLASWLLLQRAVREGDMSVEQAVEERRKVRIEPAGANAEGIGWNDLPDAFKELVQRSESLQKRVERLEQAILRPGGAASAEHNPVNDQLRELAQAFGLE